MDATDQYLSRYGHGSVCSSCGKEMFPMDGHGRFTCMCSIGQDVDVVTDTPVLPKLPQVDTVGMSDEEKAGIPPIYRLHLKPTAAEAKLLSLGIDDAGGPEYIKALEELKEERKGVQDSRIPPVFFHVFKTLIVGQ